MEKTSYIDPQRSYSNGLIYSPVIYLVLDAEGIVRYANPWAERMFGEDAAGSSIESIFPDILDVEKVDHFSRSPEVPRQFNFSSFRGEFLTYRFHFFRENDDYTVIGNPNVEELEDLQRKLADLNTELNNLNREVRKKNSELDRLSRLKDQFLGMAAHDLRNPCGAIYSFADILLVEAADKLTEEQREFLRIIIDSSSYMRRIIDDFLDLSIFESGNIDLCREKTDIVSFVRDVAELQRFQTDLQDVRLNFSSGRSIPAIYVDQSKIQQVVTNLISNAVEHAPRGSAVDVEVDSTEGEVIISVRDRGPGVPEELKNSLFSRYRTGRKGTKKDGTKSIGLGLAISEKIVQSHGGKIRLESEPGQGAVFYVALPLIEE